MIIKNEEEYFLIKREVIIALGVTFMIYISNLFGEKAYSGKLYIHLDGFWKGILGFFLYRGNRFSLENVLDQSGNLLALIIFFILNIILNSKLALGAFYILQFLNLLIVAIVVVFIDK